MHAVMVMRGLRCVLAGCVSGPRNGNETVSHHHHQHPDDETRCERSTTVAGSEPRSQRCRPRSARWLFLTCFRVHRVEYREERGKRKRGAPVARKRAFDGMPRTTGHCSTRETNRPSGKNRAARKRGHRDV